MTPEQLQKALTDHKMTIEWIKTDTGLRAAASVKLECIGDTLEEAVEALLESQATLAKLAIEKGWV